MTVSNTDSKVVYNGTGTSSFAFGFKIFEDGDLVVTKFDSDGVGTVLTLTTDYTITTSYDENGGTVTTTSAVASGERLVIQRVLDLVQETDYSEGDSFPAETHESALDRLMMAVQQLQEQLDRAIKMDVSQTADMDLPTLSTGYLYTDGATLSWADDITVTETSYTGSISHGADASKSASPNAGDIYFATDTNKLYKCATGGSWSNVYNVTTLNASSTITANGAVSLGSTLTVAGATSAASFTTGTGATVDEFSTDGTFTGNSDTACPTEKAVKTYVDANSLLSSKTYDSGWFAVVAGQTYSKTHSLGTTKIIGNIYVSQSNDNSGVVANAEMCDASGNDGAQMIALTTTSVSIKIDTDQTWSFEGANFANGYARIILLALE